VWPTQKRLLFECRYQVNLFNRLFVMSCLLGATRLPEGGAPGIANYTHHVVASLHNKAVGFASAQPTLRTTIQPGFRHGSLIKFCPEP
jgi:hypothetical protein